MTPAQERAIRLGILRILLHPASNLADLLEEIPVYEIRACIIEISNTMSARLEELAKKRIFQNEC